MRGYLNNFFWLFLTYLLAPFLYLLIFLKSRSAKHLNILVISTAKIGDIVCTTPIFREIKKRFPDCHLAVLITSKTKDLLKNNPHLDEIILIDDYSKFGLIRKLRQGNYDWSINLLLGSFNSVIGFWSLVPNRVTTTHKQAGEITKLLSVFNNHQLEYQSHTWLIGHYLKLLKFIGIEGGSEQKELFWGKNEENKALDFLQKQGLTGSDLLIGMSVTTGVKFKNWGDDNFALTANSLARELGAKIIFVGGPGDAPAIKRVQDMMRERSFNAADIFTLSEAPALIKKMKLFIGLDTGPLYIANAVGTAVIDIGGCLDFREQAPIGKNVRVLPKKNSDTYSFVDAIDSEREKWLDQQLREVTLEDVLRAARELLAPHAKN